MNFSENNNKSLRKPIQNWDEYYKKENEVPPWEAEEPEEILINLINSGEINGLCLDMGCGLGTDLIFLNKKGYSVTGIDLSIYCLKRAIQRVEKNLFSLNLLQGNVIYLPFKKETFSFINDRGCFHHIDKDLRENYVREIYRITAQEGKVLLRFFSEIYYSNGGSGQVLYKSDIKKFFEPFFEIKEISDYRGMGNKWPVDMTWCILKRRR